MQPLGCVSDVRKNNYSTAAAAILMAPSVVTSWNPVWGPSVVNYSTAAILVAPSVETSLNPVWGQTMGFRMNLLEFWTWSLMHFFVQDGGTC